jgi:hypothetical protein
MSNEFEKVGLEKKDKIIIELLERIIELLEGMGRMRPG